MRANMKGNDLPMKKLLMNTLIIISIVSIYSFPKEKASSPLHPKYKKWLAEEVIYIITPREKNVFLKLETDRERDLFIEAFWSKRDPNPLTEINEFKDEHYRRIKYANRHFGRVSPLAGSKTDRGRNYIILGPPISIQTYENLSSIYPTIVWYYQGMSKYRLPDVFNIVFFKKRGTGDYRLYSPSMDGPQSLVAHISSGQIDSRSAYRELQSEVPALAQVSLSLLPGEPVFNEMSSVASDRLLFDINSAPQKTVKDEYAEKFLLYKNIVEVEYSVNYIGNDSLVHVIRDKSGIYFVNYLLELDRFSVNLYEDTYFTKLKLNGNISDLEGNTIYQYERSIPVEFGQELFNKIEAQKYSLHDVFPLVEGNYRFNLLVKNEASKEFTSIERDITIPQGVSLQMSNLILAYKREKDLSDKKKAFKIENLLLYPSPRNDFSPKDNFTLLFQIYGLSEELKEKGSLEIVIYKGEEKFRRQQKKLREYESLDFFMEEFSLVDFPSAYYKVRVSFFDEDENEILFKESRFSISPVASFPRPWINSIVHTSSDDPGYFYVLGSQLFNKKEYERARILLERAYRRNPTSLRFALGFSNVLFILKKYKPIIEIFTPFLMKNNSEVLEPLARSHHASGEFDKAISYYKEYISHYGVNYFILSLLGDCYYQKGNKKEALKALEKSLELNPNQEEIKKLVNSIKKEKK